MRDLAPPLSLGAIGGIEIHHEIGEGIVLEDPIARDWVGGAATREPLVIRHEVGDVSVDGLRPVLDVEPWSTYFDDGRGGSVIRYRSHARQMPVRVMRTVEPGISYVVNYEFRPEIPMMRRDKELAAYTLALCDRGLGVMAHGCGFVLPRGRIALGLGVSGAGKSTLASMMLGQPRVSVLNDDRVALTVEAGGLHGWATPWPGSAGIWGEGGGRLGVIAFIGRGAERSLVQLAPREALSRLLKTLALPLWSARGMDQGLAFVERLLAEVPVVELRYPLEPDTAEWVVEALSGVAE